MSLVHPDLVSQKFLYETPTELSVFENRYSEMHLVCESAGHANPEMI